MGISRRQLIAATTAAALAPASVPAAGNRQRRPNIVFILADDLGYGDLSCYGRRDYATPAIDAIGADGMQLTQAYANSCLCSPTRMALLTGRYQYRFRGGLEEPINPRQRDFGLDPHEPTLPSILRAHGYRTALVGKWHLGQPPAFGPQKSGYDMFFGVHGGAVNHFTHQDGSGTEDLFDGATRVEANGYLTDLLTARAIDFLTDMSKKEAPFLLSLHYTAPHWPWQGPGDAAHAAEIKSLFHADGGSLEIYAAMMRNLDENVGRVTAALRRLGLEDNTIIVFTSDNGGERFSQMWPFSGEKGSLLEGGLRVPALVRWPNRIAAGTRSDQVMITMDWTASLLAAAGAPLPEHLKLDGANILPALTGAQPPVERTLFWRFKGRDQAAVRCGALKYLRIGDDEFLFDLDRDPRERANLRQSRSADFAMLKAAYAAWGATMLPVPAEVTGYAVSSSVLADAPGPSAKK